MNQEPVLQKEMHKRGNTGHDSSFRTAYESCEEGIGKGRIQLIRSMHKNGMLLEDIATFFM